MQKTEKRARGRPVGSSDQEAKRHEFVIAVMKAIAERGYKDVTVATICEAAGFSRGLIGHYFPGKDALLLHAVGEVAKDFELATRAAAEAAGQDPLDRLHAIVNASFRAPVFTPERVLVWVALASTSRWSPDLAEIYHKLNRPYRRGLANLMQRAANARGAKVNPDRLAITLTQLTEGLWSGWAADPRTISAAEGEAACHDLLDAFFPPRRVAN
ncbi:MULTISPECIES: TetR family transcriptional regulator C-terminal domain-containing protein [Bradyrhizobium]|uniref:TetR family transcriptional regulator C-terminal domain-containing protein n=1 Tax=Bradyrhizobium TaxID=374 RepID=UPI000482A508|nr:MULTISPECIES: TetR family transcriptional regulator C-terminal domain-containing protein [Bradyrhizobium]MCS3448572.1 AcrR family transcriptional regulator [Bradyrhizobium elkanii]MCS3560285.1 AcrR family transcriptional regulator [Bradyrhizobium elkanii]MCW2149869.1 AcrR family transcriptional regulator [Bradyrhizobium elkanii]MCW2360161.1 AcrR family transcriptional regulator [Bradyrhizobium elkanii]MCW2373600.1 AcrR family transcriptional regulator [Bradyrhizobium elkanii]